MALDERQQKLVAQQKQMENRKKYAALTDEIEELREAYEKVKAKPDASSERNKHTANVILRSIVAKKAERDRLE